MINVEEIGRQIGEEIANPSAPAFYPGGFKPPHRGHFAAAEQIASKPYVEKVNVIIGHGKRDKFDITPEQSKAIWDIYLEANPNPKISVEISPDASPIKPLFTYFADLDNIGYVAGAQKEIQSGYFNTLKDKFADRVMPLAVQDQFVDKDGERVSGTEFRSTLDELENRYQILQQKEKGTKDYTTALNDYNNTYEYLKSLMPEAVINKGKFDDVLDVLNLDYPTPQSLQELKIKRKKKIPDYVWLEEYKNKNQFNPAIFDGEEIDPKVKDLLLKIASFFWESLELGEPFEDVTLTGSSANYNYTPFSDIDLHILVDFNKFDNPEIIKKFFDAKKNIFNDKYDLKLGKQPIEIYVQDINEKHTSSGVYSVMDSEWIKKPEYEAINIPDGNIKKKSKPFKERIDDLIKDGLKNPEQSLSKIDKLKERIRNYRQSGLDKTGEYSLENLAFKDLRNTGYLDKLSQLSKELVTKQLSLNELLKEDTNIFENFFDWVCNELEIENPPSFEIKTHMEGDQPSFGAYHPTNHHIFLNPSNRNAVDVMRTLAHELVHAKQNELELLDQNSGETGSDIENDANAAAGVLMRDYGKQNPDIYSIGIINEKVTKDEIICDKCGNNTPFDKITEQDILSDIQEYGTLPEYQIDLNDTYDYQFSDNFWEFYDNVNDVKIISKLKFLPKDIIEFKFYPIKDNKVLGFIKLSKPNPKVLNTIFKIFIDDVLPNHNKILIQPSDYIRYRLFRAMLNNNLDGNEYKINTNDDPTGQSHILINKINKIQEQKSKINKVYLDLDGVLAGFDAHFKEMFGNNPRDFESKEGRDAFWDAINNAGVDFWADMDWEPGGQQLLDYLKSKDVELHILSSPGSSNDAIPGKNKWLKRMNIGISPNKVHYKQAKNKREMAAPDALLIDDRGSNIAQFIEDGGKGIKHNSSDLKSTILKLKKFGI